MIIPMRRLVFLALFLFIVAFFPSSASASHSWGGYHWARTINPFTLKLGDNLTSNWKPYLSTASTDWSVSSVLDTKVVPGQAKGNCRPTSGRDEVCNKAYGANGWLGLAQIWVSGAHIYQGVVKINDTYFNTATYNTPAWKRMVICQEVGHTFGLDHQDEIFNNPNLGTCMDYTNNPSGPLSNEHPNQHDFDELAFIYSHWDNFTTLDQKVAKAALGSDADLDEPTKWGRKVKDNGKVALFERGLGGDHKVTTFVIWAN